MGSSVCQEPGCGGGTRQPGAPGWAQYHCRMPLVEILDGPPEWAGVAYETDEDMVADEIGLSHPRWRGTPVRVRWGALYAYEKVEVVGDRHRYRYQGPGRSGAAVSAWART
jgi:hypothetical protein